MKEGNWDNFLSAFRVASNAECYEIGLIFLVFFCSELILHWFFKWLCGMVERRLALETLGIIGLW